MTHVWVRIPPNARGHSSTAVQGLIRALCSCSIFKKIREIKEGIRMWHTKKAHIKIDSSSFSLHNVDHASGFILELD